MVGGLPQVGGRLIGVQILTKKKIGIRVPSVPSYLELSAFTAIFFSLSTCCLSLLQHLSNCPLHCLYSSQCPTSHKSPSVLFSPSEISSSWREYIWKHKLGPQVPFLLMIRHLCSWKMERMIFTESSFSLQPLAFALIMVQESIKGVILHSIVLFVVYSSWF